MCGIESLGFSIISDDSSQVMPCFSQPCVCASGTALVSIATFSQLPVLEQAKRLLSFDVVSAVHIKPPDFPSAERWRYS